MWAASARGGQHGRGRGQALLEPVILAAIAAGISLAMGARTRGRATEADTLRKTCAYWVSEIATQADRWYFEKGTWPKPDLSDIKNDRAYFPKGIPACPVDGSAYRLDATSHKVPGHTH
jgi:hypothetical protein